MLKTYNKLYKLFFIIGLICFFISQAAYANQLKKQDSDQQPTKSDIPVSGNITLDHLMMMIEKRYMKASFSADFVQESTLKAMEMTDTARGSALFKYPGMMHWKYQDPEEQFIITDGSNLWIYRSEDNQVMVGKAPQYFGEGKGASFLTDIKVLRESFQIAWAKDDLSAPKVSDAFYLIRLEPKKQNPDFTTLFLAISKENYDVVELITDNAYQDRTRIQFKNIQFHQDIDDVKFMFQIPKGTDIIRMDQP